MEVNKEFCIHKDSTLKFECSGSVMSADFNSVSWTHDLDLGVSKGKFSAGDESRISIHGEVQKGDTKQVVKLTLNEVRWNPPVSMGGNPYVIGDAPHGEMELLSGQRRSEGLGKRAGSVGASGTKVRVGKENRKRVWVQAMEVMPTPKKKTKHASPLGGGGVGPPQGGGDVGPPQGGGGVAPPQGGGGVAPPQGGVGPESEDDVKDVTMDDGGGSNDVSDEEDESDEEESGGEESEEEEEVTRVKPKGGKKVQVEGPMFGGYETTKVKAVSVNAGEESGVGTLSFSVPDVRFLGFGAPRSGELTTNITPQMKELVLQNPIVLLPSKGNCGLAWTLGVVHDVEGEEQEEIIGVFRNGACAVDPRCSGKAAEHLGIKIDLVEKYMKPVVKNTKKSKKAYGDDRDAVVKLCQLVSGWFLELDSYRKQGSHFFDTWAEACAQGRIQDWSKVTNSNVFRKEEFVFTGPNRGGTNKSYYPTERFVAWAIQHFRHPALLPA